MDLEPGFWAVVVWAAAGLLASVAIDRLLEPRVPLARPWGAWALHTGMWLVLYVAYVVVLGRPGFGAASVSAWLLLVVMVNNAKFKALREPFVFPDYEYFTDAIRHPRLYIPFLGWGKFVLCMIGVLLAVALGLWGEAVPARRLSVSGQAGAIALMLLAAVALLWAGHRQALPVTFVPRQDLAFMGLLASLWRYGQCGRRNPEATSPFAAVIPGLAAELPHLVSVQSESFFDARRLWPGIRPEVLEDYDRMRSESVLHGGLRVPAWGANTVRSEFAFLSGIEGEQLGVHRFNPYRAVSAGWQLASVASTLKNRGYRTICIHPYPASFYQRDVVYPRLGFDSFLDITAFDAVVKTGPYIDDLTVAEKVDQILRDAREPVFIHVITMENHGPLHLERINAGDIERLYREPPPAGCDDLTIYLRHLCSADAMVACLRGSLQRTGRPSSLCWYGDHVPIMPEVYAALGEPSGDVDYLIWTHGLPADAPSVAALSIDELALRWLQCSGVVMGQQFGTTG